MAKNLGLNAEILESWLKALNSIRNICAHHSRLWNRKLGIAIKIPQSSQIRWLFVTP
ncbi:Abi family protein [Pelistega sp. MC2]|uniref:Abi family protein n=1 Tax=Pelistega sp. MC2 TaxID=1720297 RepID=UPI001C4093D8